MDDLSHTGRRRPGALTLALAALGLAGAVVVSGTRPFTLAADVAVGVLIGAVWILAAARGRRQRGMKTTTASTAGVTWRALAPWVVLAATVVGWELFCYLSAPRLAHPTLSSMADAVDRWRAGKFVLCGLWLALGARLAAVR